MRKGAVLQEQHCRTWAALTVVVSCLRSPLCRRWCVGEYCMTIEEALLLLPATFHFTLMCSIYF